MDFNWLHIVMQIILQHYIETDLSVTKKVATGIVAQLFAQTYKLTSWER